MSKKSRTEPRFYDEDFKRRAVDMVLATRGKPRLQRRVLDEMLLIVAGETVPLRANRRGEK